MQQLLARRRMLDVCWDIWALAFNRMRNPVAQEVIGRVGLWPTEDAGELVDSEIEWQLAANQDHRETLAAIREEAAMCAGLPTPEPEVGLFPMCDGECGDCAYPGCPV